MAKNNLFGGKDPFEMESTWEDEVATKEKDRSNEFATMFGQQSQKRFQPLQKGDRIRAKLLQFNANTAYFDVGQRAEASMDLVQFDATEKTQLAVGQEFQLFVAETANGIELVKSLSAAQASTDMLQIAYDSGLPVDGKVISENKGGFEVEVLGAKGFVPFSQIDVVAQKNNADYIGKTFKFRISRFQGREVVLSRTVLLREEQDSKRQETLNKLEVGQTLSGKIQKLEEFGAFIDIGGLTALIPRSEMSWSRLPVQDSVKLDQEVLVKIIKIDRTSPKLRVAASIKQVEGDPWDILITRFTVGQTVSGTVTRNMAFGCFVELAPGLEGLVHLSEMSGKRKISQPGEVVKPGDVIEVKITGIDSLQKRLSLSLKALSSETMDDDTRKKYLKNQDEANEHRGVELVSNVTSSSAFGEAFSKAEKKQKKN